MHRAGDLQISCFVQGFPLGEGDYEEMRKEIRRRDVEKWDREVMHR